MNWSTIVLVTLAVSLLGSMWSGLIAGLDNLQRDLALTPPQLLLYEALLGGLSAALRGLAGNGPVLFVVGLLAGLLARANRLPPGSQWFWALIGGALVFLRTSAGLIEERGLATASASVLTAWQLVSTLTVAAGFAIATAELLRRLFLVCRTTARMSALVFGAAIAFWFGVYGLAWIWRIYLQQTPTAAEWFGFGVWALLALLAGWAVHRLVCALTARQTLGLLKGAAGLGAVLAALIGISYLLGPPEFDTTQKPLARSADGEAPVRPGIEPRRASQAPNVLLLVLDTVRADALSCYGNPRPTTPNIDRIAAEGVRYEHAFSGSGWTLPAHAAIFSGRMPSQTESWAERLLLPDEEWTLPEVLSAAGWATFGISNNGYVSAEKGMAQGFDSFAAWNFGQRPAGRGLIAELKTSVQTNDYGARVTIAEAIDWIGRRQAEDRAWMVFLNLMEAHREWGVTHQRHRWLDQGQIVRSREIVQNPHELVVGNVEMNEADAEILHLMYEGDVAYIDERLGELFDYLRAQALLDNTVVIVTADHGEAFYENGFTSHFYHLYNTVTHVPLILRYPPSIDSGTVRSDAVQSFDIYPTLLDLLDLEGDPDQTLAGRSLLSPPPSNRHIFNEMAVPVHFMADTAKSDRTTNFGLYAHRLKAVQTLDWKFVWNSDGDHLFFDLSRDPLEQTNIYDSSRTRANEAIRLLCETIPWRMYPYCEKPAP